MNTVRMAPRSPKTQTKNHLAQLRCPEFHDMQTENERAEQYQKRTATKIASSRK